MPVTPKEFESAKRHFQRGEYESAIQDASKLLEEDAQASAGWTIRGFSRQAMGQHTNAAKDFKQALAIDPGSHQVLNGLVQSLVELDQPETALTYIDQMLEQKPTPEVLLSQADLRRQIAWLHGAAMSRRSAIALDPNNALLCYRTANIVFRRGDPALAQQILRDNFQDADLNFHLLDGQIAYSLRDPDSARQRAKHVLGATSDRTLGFEAALLLFQAGPFEEAANAFADLAEQEDATVKAVAWHTRCLIFAGDPKARQWTDILLSTFSTEPEAHCVAGIYYATEKHFTAAVPHLEQAIEMDDTIAEAHLLLGECYRETGDKPKALKANEKGRFNTQGLCVSGELNHVLSSFNRWDLLRVLGRKIQANAYGSPLRRCEGLADVQLLQQAIETRDNRQVSDACTEVLNNLHGNRTPWPTRKARGSVGATRVHLPIEPRHESRRLQTLMQTRLPGEVVDSFTPLLEELPNHPGVLCHRGEILLWFGQYAKAAEDFEAALSASMKTRWAWIGLGASQILTGEYTAGFTTFSRSTKYALAGRTMWVYRAEGHWRAGQIHKARKCTKTALQINPTRSSAHILNGILCAHQGDWATAQTEFAFVHAQHPMLWRQVALTKDIVLNSGESPENKDLIGFFETALLLMRGNRSSNVVTWFFQDRLHVHSNQSVRTQ